MAALLKLQSLLRVPGRDGGDLIAVSFWSLVLRAAGMLSTFVLGIQLARYLGPAQYGVYGLILAVAMLLSAVAQVGLPTLATRELAIAWSRRNFADLKGILRWFAVVVFAVSIVLGGAFVLGFELWPGAAADKFETPALIGAALVPPFALTVLLSAELRALDRLVLGQSLEILVRPLTQSLLCLGVFLALGSLGVRSALILNVMASMFALFLALVWLKQRLPSEVRLARPKHHLRAWLRSAGPLALTDVMRQLDGVYAVLLMGFLATIFETGIFRVAQSSMMLVATPLFVVQVVVAPTLARLNERDDKARLQSLLTIAARITFGAAALGTILITLGGAGLVAFIFGPEYRAAWAPLVVLCASQMVSGFFGVGFVLLPMARAERELTICYAASVSISMIFAVMLVPRYGAMGAAISAVVGALINGLVARYFAWRLVGVETSIIG